MSHGLLFYPSLSITWMDFCKSGGKNQRCGNSLLSLASLTRFLAPKVRPAAGGSSAGRLGTASLLAPEVPRTSLPREPRRLHQPPVPVLNHTREKNTANT